MNVPEAFAQVIGDAWLEACEEATRYPTATEVQRQTFRAMARWALAAARAGGRSEDEVAKALCAGFWEGSPNARSWPAHGRQQQEVFRIVARRVIALGRELRAARATGAVEREPARAHA